MSDAISAVEKLIDQGRYSEALARLTGAASSPDLRLKQLYALALSKSGVPEAALEFMEPVYSQFPDDPESAGIMGSICKELFKKNQSNIFALRSRDTYYKNFVITRNYYTGINAASMSAMAGQISRGREIAKDVIARLEVTSNDYWILATLGEAWLLNKDKAKSVDYYVQARRVAGRDWGKVTSVYSQLWLLNHFLPVPAEILRLFHPPGVVAFVGHMIDHPHRAAPRFPASIEKEIKDSIVHSIRTLNARIGYCSLACGGDILFAEAIAEEGGEVNIFIPFEVEDFVKTSLEFAGVDWVNRFDKLRNEYPVTFISHEHYDGYDDIFAFQSKIIFGASVLRSETYHEEPSLLTVLSEVDLKKKEGGTRDTLMLWPYPKKHINVNPDRLTQVKEVQVVPEGSQTGAKEYAFVERPVCYLVCADLSDITGVERSKIEASYAEKKADAWSVPGNDGKLLVAVFRSESAALQHVRFLMESLKNLWHQSACKISLHAGPVLFETMENSNEKKLAGRALQLVRELNPLATSGSIVASSHFAALLALTIKSFEIDYCGVWLSGESDEKITLYKIKFRNLREF